MANRTFSLKLITIDQKVTKNHQKLINICDMKMRSNLTTKKGDSGSALMLGEKCVMIEAPNLDTRIDQNSSQTRKMTKNDQNSVKQKNSKK